MQARSPLVAIPVKPFGVAKQRLQPRLDAAARSRLGRAVASRTAQVASAAGASVVFVTGDPGVNSWAEAGGFATIDESAAAGSGLDRAAAAARDCALAQGRPWLLLHADLPLVTVADIAALLSPLMVGRAVIAPSYDGGTSALGSHRYIDFAYGSGSFHRHLRHCSTAQVVVRPGLAHDLDTVADLDEIRSHPDGQWINPLMTTIDSRP